MDAAKIEPRARGARRSLKRLAALPRLLAIAFITVAACSANGEPIDAGSGVETVDAAEAAARRGLPTDPEGAVPSPDPDAQTTTSEPATTQTYPEVTGEINEPADDTVALLTSTGVVVGVTGQTADGYVVDTPCGGVTTVASGQPLGPVQVVLDPGHGGDEAGAKDVPNLTEADLNLAVARAAAAELERRAITVMLIRDADYRIPIRRRAELADQIAPTVFISIHHNTPASRPSPEPGTEVYIQTGSAESRRLGGLLYESVFEALKQFDVEWTARDDAGVLTVVNDAGDDAYGIARYPTTTSALIEMAYLGNEKEAALLMTDEYLEVAAASLADGIERFLTTREEGSGFVDEPRLFNPSGATGGASGCVDPALE